MNISRIIAASLIGIYCAAATHSAFAYSGESLAKDAKISLTQAHKIALQTQPGKITDTELEQEPGGSGLRYSFDITQIADGTTHEVGIDAQTGAVLENTVDGAHPD